MRVPLSSIELSMFGIVCSVLIACVSMALVQNFFFDRFFNVIFLYLPSVVRGNAVNALVAIASHVKAVVAVNGAVPQVELALGVVFLVGKLVVRLPNG